MNFNVQAILAQLASQHPEALFQLNMALAENGLPFYYNGGASFNTEYRLYPTPRWVFKWIPPFIHLNQIYLSYKAGSSEQIDLVYDVEWNNLKVVRLTKGN